MRQLIFRVILIAIFLVFSFLIVPFATKAQTISITQDDWSGGSGQSIWSDETKFYSEDGEGLYTSNGLRMKINADTVVGQDNFEDYNPNNAKPANSVLYAPGKVFFDGNKFFVVDNSNHRVLIYNSIPTTNSAVADVVIGQADFVTNTYGASATKLYYPQDVYSDGARLFIADSNNHRVLIYNTIPTTNGAAADVIIGQENFTDNQLGLENNKLNYPTDLSYKDDKLFILDTNNNRMLIYNSIPTANGTAADVVIGQTDFVTKTTGTSSTKFYYPYGLFVSDSKLFVGDSYNHRVLIYNSIPTTNGAAADVVIGQVNFTSRTSGASSTKLFFPKDIDSDGEKLFLTDFNNNRVLIYNTIPTTNGAAANLVIGQDSLTTRISGTSSVNLFRPSSIFLAGSKLLISDTANNRILIYNSIPNTNGVAADVVVGQVDFNLGRINGTIGELKKGFYFPHAGLFVDNKLIVADSSNNRVLIYNSIPTDISAEADVVIGQPDFLTTTSGVSDIKMDYPVDIASDGSRLFVVDYYNNRILIYNSIPTTNGAAADVVIGQPDFVTSSSGTSAVKLMLPWGVHTDGVRVFISDTENNRILIYNSIPSTNGVAADVVIGQTDFITSLDGANDSKLNYPVDVYCAGEKLFVADSSNSRVLIYNSVPTSNGAAADVAVGQADLFSSDYGGPTSMSLKYPEEVFSDGSRLFIADYYNSRVLMYNSIPSESGMAADIVIGQADFDSVTSEDGGRENIKGPYDVYYKDSKLLITDGSDHRLLIFNSDQVSSSLTSSTFTSETDQDWGPISFQADTPDNTDVKVEVSIDGGSWNEVTNNQDYIGRGKTLAYKVTLISKDGLSTPTFQSISFGQAAKDDSGIITTLKKIFGNSDKLKLKNNQVIKSQSKTPILRGEEPKLKNGKVEVYLNNELNKTISINDQGYWNDKLKLKDKSYNITFKYIDEFNTLLKTERIKLKVDSEKPTFKEKINKNQTVKRGQKITFTAKDEGLGIDYYKIKLLNDKGHVFKSFKKQTKDYYIIPQTLKDGNYTLVIKVYDEAKNYAQKKIDLNVGR